MAMIEIEAIITTSCPIEAYGGVQLGDDTLEEMAAALRVGSLPMLRQHDIRQPMNAKVIDAQVRDRSDGYKEVWARIQVDSDDWAEFERQTTSVGASGGFSFSCSEPLAELPALNEVPGSTLELDADASHWTDEELLAAAEELRSVGAVRVGRRYEFSFTPASVVDLQVVGDIVTGVVANTIFYALLHFLKRSKTRPGSPVAVAEPPINPQPTVFHFDVGQSDGTTIKAHLETDNEDVLRKALNTFDAIVSPERLYIWDDDDGRWKPGVTR